MSVAATCAVCGGPLGAPWCVGRSPTGLTPICHGCYLDGLVPCWYPDSEIYQYDPIWHQLNATERPPTGVGVLDANRGRQEMLRLWQARWR